MYTSGYSVYVDDLIEYSTELSDGIPPIIEAVSDFVSQPFIEDDYHHKKRTQLFIDIENAKINITQAIFQINDALTNMGAVYNTDNTENEYTENEYTENGSTDTVLSTTSTTGL